MPIRPSPRLPRFGWDIVDATITSASEAAPLHQIMQLVMTDWTLETQIDVGAVSTERLLTKHRISTLVPTSNVVAHQRDAHRARLATIYGVQMRVESTAVEVLELLADAGIDTRVLKGLASAELDYPTRHFRQTGDVDVALPLHQFDQAVRVLKHHGYSDHQTVNSSFLLKGTTLDAPNGVEVDIHTRLFQRSPLHTDLFADPGQRLSDMPSAGLCAEHRLVHAAGHFILTPPGSRRISGLVDITRIRSHPQLDLEKARNYAAELGVEPLVGASLRLEAHLAERTTTPHDLVNWCAPDWLDRATRLSPKRRLTLDHISRFRDVPRSQWIRYLPVWLLPDERQRRLFAHSIRQSGTNVGAAIRARLGHHRG